GPTRCSRHSCARRGSGPTAASPGCPWTTAAPCQSTPNASDRVSRMGGFRIVGQSTVATGGFLQLADLRVEGPDGTVHERFVVRHPGAVVVVPVTDDRAHALL